MHSSLYIGLSATLYLAGLLLLYYGQYNDAPASANSYRSPLHHPPGAPRTTEKKKLILMWAKFFGGESWKLDADCTFALSGQCELTYNRSRLGEADAIVFHAPDFFSEKPHTMPEDFMGTDNDTRGSKRMVPRVFMSMESAAIAEKDYRLREFPSESWGFRV